MITDAKIHRQLMTRLTEGGDDEMLRQKLRDSVIELRRGRVAKQKLLDVLEGMRGEFYERREDIILDVIDMLVGWTASASRID